MSESTVQTGIRTSLSKKLRFEVLKRDSFKCQYCGRSAPDVLLHVDHIKPVVDGGGNDITNLICACEACNLGKSGNRLDDNTVVEKRKAQLDALQERQEQLEMMMEWMDGLKGSKERIVERLSIKWETLAKGYELNEKGLQTIRKWMNKYSVEEIMKAMDIAADQYLEFQANGMVTEDSWDKAFNKTSGILRVEKDSKTDPDLIDLLYIRGILKNKCENYFKKNEAMELLRDARSWGISISELQDLSKGVYSWSDFKFKITGIIDEQKNAMES